MSGRIVEGDYDSWHQDWPATADRAPAEDFISPVPPQCPPCSLLSTS
ncbi:hypothetical protein ACFZCP_39910 [Streptomyces sp. NPDC007971]